MKKYEVAYSAPGKVFGIVEAIKAERFEYIPANSHPGLMTVSCIAAESNASAIFYGPGDEVVFAVSAKYLVVRLLEVTDEG